MKLVTGMRQVYLGYGVLKLQMRLEEVIESNGSLYPHSGVPPEWLDVPVIVESEDKDGGANAD